MPNGETNRDPFETGFDFPAGFVPMTREMLEQAVIVSDPAKKEGGGIEFDADSFPFWN